MRGLTNREMLKRGCMYCADHKYQKLYPEAKRRNHACPYWECPYHELDPFEKYTDYLKSPQQNALKVAMEKIMNPERRIE